ncbi:hypothetical protein ATANTOWER_032497 [Ataeniobius toweri]|uniref:Uncharacterized protein n=1 Tax=Ataeniobius toweri TaxID=208326 RepID=A0ABU7AW11_9TELE|nr:hypothetical protein [Ataeniobius toweri]
MVLLPVRCGQIKGYPLGRKPKETFKIYSSTFWLVNNLPGGLDLKYGKPCGFSWIVNLRQRNTSALLLDLSRTPAFKTPTRSFLPAPSSHGNIKPMSLPRS